MSVHMHVQSTFPAILAALAAGILVTAVTTAPVRAERTCMTDWSEAGPIVRREGLATIELVGRLARDKAAVEIIASTLCRDDDHYVYRLLVRGHHGSLRTLVVDARNPFGP